MLRRAARIAVIALACGCHGREKQEPRHDPPAPAPEPEPPRVVPVPTVVAVPLPAPDAALAPDASKGSRDVAAEGGVPLDQTVLGAQPHPFGALEGMSPRATRDDVLALAPNGRRDAEDSVLVPLAVDQLTAKVRFDFTHHLDWVEIELPDTARPLLERAWGKPIDNGSHQVWFDRTRRWRADLDARGMLTIGRYVPLEELIGTGPDGLAEREPIIGRTLEDVRAAYGDRISTGPMTKELVDAAPDEQVFALMMPASDVCMYFTDGTRGARFAPTAGRLTLVAYTSADATEEICDRRRRAIRAGWYGPTVVDVLNLYLDDSGTRHPDRLSTPPPHGHDWFGLGGVLVRDDESGEDVVRARHSAFCAKWKIAGHLHSSEIRNKSKQFRWLRKLSSSELDEFFRDIGELVTAAELTALACVVDRPGYNARYRPKYGRARWLLCRTAFAIVVERAVKHARVQRAKLRVLVERSDRDTDQMIRGYYDALRSSGHPFDVSTAATYSPLSNAEYKETLYEFRAKEKSSPLMQIADLVLWPICIGGYEKNNNAFMTLKDASVLIDDKIDPSLVAERGIKYSCWDLEDPKKAEPGLATGSGQPPEGDLVG